MPSNDNNLTSVSKRARRIWVQLLAVAVIVAIVAPVRGQVPTSGALSGTRPRHWHKYSNSSCGFSFWYPDPYRPVSLPAPSENDAFRHYEKRLLLLERRDLEDASARTAENQLSASDTLKEFLELADRACLLYEKALPQERRQLIQIVTSNRLVDGRTPLFTLGFPFCELSVETQQQYGGRRWTRTIDLVIISDAL